MNNDYNGDFKSKEEFESVIGRGCELGFEWKGHEYCIFRQNDNTWFFGKQDAPLCIFEIIYLFLLSTLSFSQCA